MANNRLYIVDADTGDRFMLAKSMGDGWYLRGENEGEPTFAARFEAWCDGRDPCSYGNPRLSRSHLVLICENDPDTADETARAKIEIVERVRESTSGYGPRE